MHLEKIEIQGFKSFAKRTVIGLPARPAGGEGGIIAVVGPNGAGKSNIATALFTGTTLVTRNARDFQKVPNLALLKVRFTIACDKLKSRVYYKG